LCEHRTSTKDVSHKAELQGKSMFKDARAEAEEQIYERLKAKIDESFELSKYDWTLSEPQGRASDYIFGLVGYLQSIFLAFTNLPVSMTIIKSLPFLDSRGYNGGIIFLDRFYVFRLKLRVLHVLLLANISTKSFFI